MKEGGEVMVRGGGRVSMLPSQVEFGGKEGAMGGGAGGDGNEKGY